MKILFLCNKSPWPPREGGPIAMNMFISGLAANGHTVKTLAVNSWKYNVSRDEIPQDYISKTGLELIDVDLKIKPFGAMKALIQGRSYHVSRFKSEKFASRVKEILTDEEFDIVQLESLFMGPYIPVIRKYSKAGIVLRAHNIEHLIWNRIAAETKNPVKRWYLRQLAGSLKKYEENICFLVDGIVSITQNDAHFFMGLLNEKKNPALKLPLVAAIPFGVRVDTRPLQASASPAFSLFTLGAMNWIPNQEGVRWFLEKVWPDVHKQFPFVKYFLAGRAMPDWMLNLDMPNVIVEGEIEDAAGFYDAHSVMVVPLFSGSGIRIKIIEGMAAGKTIISTSVGAEGIDYTAQNNILIADTPCDFFSMISLCVFDPEMVSRMGKNAKELIAKSYNPVELISRLEAFYVQLS